MKPFYRCPECQKKGAFLLHVPAGWMGGRRPVGCRYCKLSVSIRGLDPAAELAALEIDDERSGPE